MSNKVFDKVREALTGKYTKLVQVKVSRGKTAFPTRSKDKQNLGVRFDYDGEEIAEDGTIYNWFQVQPNAGDDVPAFIKEWRKNNGGTHAVMGRFRVKQGGTQDDVDEAMDKFVEKFKEDN